VICARAAATHELVPARVQHSRALALNRATTPVPALHSNPDSSRTLSHALQAWYATHPPKRGDWWMGTRPFVHQGFLKSWTANGLNTNIVERCVVAVQKMLKESYGAPIKAYITGGFMQAGGAWAPGTDGCPICMMPALAQQRTSHLKTSVRWHMRVDLTASLRVTSSSGDEWRLCSEFLDYASVARCRPNERHARPVSQRQLGVSQRALCKTTGHSLGGALATLAAIDLRKAVPDRAHLDLSCYTFGAPRTGNHAFAHEYNELVPDTWGVINDQASRAGVPGLQMLCQQILLVDEGLPIGFLPRRLSPACMLCRHNMWDVRALSEGCLTARSTTKTQCRCSQQPSAAHLSLRQVCHTFHGYCLQAAVWGEFTADELVAAGTLGAGSCIDIMAGIV